MNRPQVRGYRPPHRPLNVSDIGNLIEEIPTLTKVGGVCLVTGKFFGVLAIPAVFIPGLQSIAIFLVITWGTLVFTAIALCSYEHFRKKKIETDEEKMVLISHLISENPTLREQLATTIEQDKVAEMYGGEKNHEDHKVIQLAPKIHLRQS